MSDAITEGLRTEITRSAAAHMQAIRENFAEARKSLLDERWERPVLEPSTGTYSDCFVVGCTIKNGSYGIYFGGTPEPIVDALAVTPFFACQFGEEVADHPV